MTIQEITEKVKRETDMAIELTQQDIADRLYEGGWEMLKPGFPKTSLWFHPHFGEFHPSMSIAWLIESYRRIITVEKESGMTMQQVEEDAPIGAKQSIMWRNGAMARWASQRQFVDNPYSDRDEREEWFNGWQYIDDQMKKLYVRVLG